MKKSRKKKENSSENNSRKLFWIDFSIVQYSEYLGFFKEMI